MFFTPIVRAAKWLLSKSGKTFADAFQDRLNQQSDPNICITENGTAGFRTSGKTLLDLNYRAASLRNATEEEIISLFTKAFDENRLHAIKWLFYTRDCREGLGERRLFRIISKHLCEKEPDTMRNLLLYIPFYGRWDDLWELLDTPLEPTVVRIIKSELAQTENRLAAGEPISLLGKWLPSANASSPKTKRLAHRIRGWLNMSEKEYRKLLSTLRAHLRIVERDMSANKWGDIDYEAVPSKANLLYSGAFMRHDEERRRNFLSSLERGEAKINSSVLYPHDIVHRYIDDSMYGNETKPYDQTLEGLWKNLPNIANGAGNTIVVADGSGSMMSTISGTNVSALSIASALAIYFAERSEGQFKDKYITFSTRPHLVDLSHCATLRDKIEKALQHDEVADTNIEAVFDLVLNTAISNGMSQSELPQNILIISDMEFNGCAVAGESKSLNARLFDEISARYTEAGYKLPRLIFWNVGSRTHTVPLVENELGTALVSGFSTNIFKMVLSGELDAYQCLIEQLMGERYTPIVCGMGSGEHS